MSNWQMKRCQTLRILSHPVWCPSKGGWPFKTSCIWQYEEEPSGQPVCQWYQAHGDERPFCQGGKGNTHTTRSYQQMCANLSNFKKINLVWNNLLPRWEVGWSTSPRSWRRSGPSGSKKRNKNTTRHFESFFFFFRNRRVLPRLVSDKGRQWSDSGPIKMLGI